MDLAERVQWMRPLSDITRIWGEELSIRPFDDPWMHIYLLADTLVDAYPRLFENNVGDPVKMMAFIHASRFSQRQAHALAGRIPGWAPITAEQELEAALAANDMVRGSAATRPAAEVRAHVASAVEAVLRYVADLKDLVAQAVRTAGIVAGPPEPVERRIGTMVFTDAVPPNRSRVVLRWRGKTAAFYANPAALYYFFGELARLAAPVRQAVEARNAALRRYAEFTMRHNGGEAIYMPWWVTSAARAPDRLRLVVCEARALLGGRIFTP